MQALMLLIQAMSQNVALCCCALFAGGACYVSLVEQPALQGTRNDLTAAYLLLAQPRPGMYAGFFALVGGLTGIAAGASSGSHWWLVGGILLMVAAVLQLGMIGPQTRSLLFGRNFGRHEDDRLSEAIAGQNRVEQPILVVEVVGVVNDLGQHIVVNFCAQFDTLRISREAARNGSDPAIQRSGKEHGLTLRGQARRNQVDVVDKAHVQHPVGFVEHQGMNHGKVQSAAFKVVKHAPGGRDQEFRAI
jgi:hypothetical protein